MVVLKKPDRSGPYANPCKHQGSAREETGPDPAAGLKLPQNHGTTIDVSYSPPCKWQFHVPPQRISRGAGDFQEPGPPGKGAALIRSPPRWRVLHSPAPCALPALWISLWKVLESGFGGDATWGRKVPFLWGTMGPHCRVSQDRQHGGCGHAWVYLHAQSLVRVSIGLIQEHPQSEPQPPACGWAVLQDPSFSLGVTESPLEG